MKTFIPLIVALSLLAVNVQAADSSLGLLKRLLEKMNELDIAERDISHVTYNSATKQVIPRLMICVNGDAAQDICASRNPTPTGHKITIENSAGTPMTTVTLGHYYVTQNGKKVAPSVSPIDVSQYSPGTYTVKACETYGSGSTNHCGTKTFTI